MLIYNKKYVIIYITLLDVKKSKMSVPLSLPFLPLSNCISKPLFIDLSTNLYYTLSVQNANSLNLTPFFNNKNINIKTIFVHTDDRHQELLRIITVYTLYTVVSRLLNQNNM